MHVGTLFENIFLTLFSRNPNAFGSQAPLFFWLSEDNFFIACIGVQHEICESD